MFGRWKEGKIWKGWVGYEVYSFSYQTLAEKMAASTQATDHRVSLSTSLSMFMYILYVYVVSMYVSMCCAMHVISCDFILLILRGFAWLEIGNNNIRRTNQIAGWRRYLTDFSFLSRPCLFLKLWSYLGHYKFHGTKLHYLAGTKSVIESSWAV